MMTRHEIGTASVVRGNARNLPLADDTVDLVVTSPPYFALRSYTDAGEHYSGQIGDEPTPQEFLDSLLEVTAECVRVLKPSGSLWVNLGDKYSDRAGPEWAGSSDRLTGRTAKPRRASSTGMAPRKSLLGLPWRYAIRCVDELGLILRAEVVWDKPNGLPESVTDRVRRSHEQWFHFTLEPRYFSAVDEIRERHVRTWGANNGGTRPAQAAAGSQYDGLDQSAPNPLGKLPGSVWTIATEPLNVPAELGIDHFAAFPTEWPKRLIQGWSPAGVCVACGDGRRPISSASTTFDKARDQAHATEIAKRGAAHSVMSGGTAKSTLNGVTTRVITGYTCACADASAPTRPAVVLDPFGGTGTTAMVAKALGRHGVTVDMSADYCRLAEWRTNDRDQLAKVLGIAKAVDVQPVDQLDIFSALDPIEGTPA